MQCPICLSNDKCCFLDCLDGLIQDIEKKTSDKYKISIGTFQDRMKKDICFICSVNIKTTPGHVNCPACQFRYLMEEDLDIIEEEFPKFKPYFLLSTKLQASEAKASELQANLQASEAKVAEPQDKPLSRFTITDI